MNCVHYDVFWAGIPKHIPWLVERFGMEIKRPTYQHQAAINQTLLIQNTLEERPTEPQKHLMAHEGEVLQHLIQKSQWKLNNGMNIYHRSLHLWEIVRVLVEHIYTNVTGSFWGLRSRCSGQRYRIAFDRYREGATGISGGDCLRMTARSAESMLLFTCCLTFSSSLALSLRSAFKHGIQEYTFGQK